MLPLTHVGKDSFWCFVLNTPLRTTPVKVMCIGELQEQGDFSRKDKLGSEGGHNMKRAVTSLTGHGPAVSELGSPGTVVAATASINSPATIRESNKSGPLSTQETWATMWEHNWNRYTYNFAQAKTEGLGLRLNWAPGQRADCERGGPRWGLSG